MLCVYYGKKKRLKFWSEQIKEEWEHKQHDDPRTNKLNITNQSIETDRGDVGLELVEK